MDKPTTLLCPKNEWDCHSRANEEGRAEQNGTITKINGMKLFLKILILTVHEWQIRMYYISYKQSLTLFPIHSQSFLIKISKKCILQYCSLSSIKYILNNVCSSSILFYIRNSVQYPSCLYLIRQHMLPNVNQPMKEKGQKGERKAKKKKEKGNKIFFLINLNILVICFVFVFCSNFFQNFDFLNITTKAVLKHLSTQFCPTFFISSRVNAFFLWQLSFLKQKYLITKKLRCWNF